MQVQANAQTTKPVSANSGIHSSPVAPASVSATRSTLLEELNLQSNNAKSKKNRQKKQIPTILGLLVLFVALISGVLLFSQGTGVFAPRATPETTPKNIRVSNVTDKTITISFYTDESTVAFVKYGEEAGSLTKQASDDRDQLSGIVKDYRLHHITLRNLIPAKTYFYVLGTGSSTFDNSGQPYSLATATKPSQSPVNSQTIYGNVLKSDGSPSEGAVVYVYSEGMGTLSTLVKSSGSWGISLANAFNTDKTAYTTLTSESPINIKVQGIEVNLVSDLQTTVGAASPVADITLGRGGAVATASATTSNLPAVDKEALLAGTSASELTTTTASASLEAIASDQATTSTTTSASDSAIAVVAPVVLDLNNLSETQTASATTITTTQPQIKAVLPANTMVRVVIHSDTKIDEVLQTDASGNMTLDVSSLGQNLEPGEHTASYTYTDPTTGKEVTKTYKFTVAANATSANTAASSASGGTGTTASRQLAAATGLKLSTTPVPSIPYGSGNPYLPSSSSKTATSSSGKVSTKSAIVATTSGQYNSGSVGTTIALLFGGVFFVLAGVWSYFLATSFDNKKDH